MATKKLVTHTAKDAFKRVKPLLDRLRDDINSARIAVAREYDSLPKLEKEPFADLVKNKYGWSQSRLKTFARIGREFPKKQRVLTDAGVRQIDETNSEVLNQIVSMSDSDIKVAAKAGLFTEDVSKRDIIQFRKTGKLQTDKPKTKKPKTDLDKIRVLMVNAEDHMRKASLDIGKIAALMYDSGITDAKGREATALVKTFEKLCTEFASVNPVTSKRAFQILRGEA